VVTFTDTTLVNHLLNRDALLQPYATTVNGFAIGGVFESSASRRARDMAIVIRELAALRNDAGWEGTRCDERRSPRLGHAGWPHSTARASAISSAKR